MREADGDGGGGMGGALEQNRFDPSEGPVDTVLLLLMFLDVKVKLFIWRAIYKGY